MSTHLSKNFTEMAMQAIRGYVKDTKLPLLLWDETEQHLILHPSHERMLDGARETLLSALTMTEEQAEAYAVNEYFEAMREYIALENRRHAEEERRQSMIRAVKNWKPSAECAEIKKRIQKELGKDMDREFSVPPRPERLSGKAFRAREIRRAQESVALHEVQIAQFKKTIKALNAWLDTARKEVHAHAVALEKIS